MAKHISKQYEKTLRLTILSILTALVVVLQVSGTAIKLGGTSIALTLIPIALGGMILGVKGGAFLGFMFGLIVFVMGATGLDGFTFVLFTDHPILTALTCFGKGIAAGAAAGFLYTLLSKKNGLAATFAAAAVTPIVNTGLFILMALFMSDTLSTNFVADGQTVIYFLVIVCAGLNFIFEFLLNLIVSPALNMLMIQLGFAPKPQKNTQNI